MLSETKIFHILVFREDILPFVSLKLSLLDSSLFESYAPKASLGHDETVSNPLRLIQGFWQHSQQATQLTPSL